MSKKIGTGVTKNKGMIFVVMLLTFLMVAGGVVSASGVTTNRLNFYDSEQHTVTISSTLSANVSSSSTMPTGFSFVSSASGCTNPSGQTVTCSNVPTGSTATFIISSPSSGTEYQLYNLVTTLNGTSLNNVSFINIRDDEIFHTLVEYGRGRGNYFYDSMGTSTSAGTGTGYNYVPNATDFELNYLHKIYNIKQYYSLASDSYATNVDFSCVYPYHTVVRQHLTESISNDGNDWTVTYNVPRIEGSWERMGFLGEDFDAGEYNVGDTFVVNCTNMSYDLNDAHGSIVVDEDSFDMEVRNPNALGVTASSDTSSIGNGTSEVLITYTITNNEQYPIDSLMLEIDSPEEAVFVGVRGELWGTAKDSYSYELPNLGAGESVQLKLLARFDTSSSSDTTLLLSEGVKAKYVQTWELNAYNPMTYLQSLSITDTQTVNYAVSSTITNLLEQINRIETNTIAINTTTNSIYTLVQEINSTTHTTSDNVIAMNSSLSSQMTSSENNILGNISSLSSQMTSFENTVQQLVNCTANSGAPLCVKMDNLNTSIANMHTDMLSINDSLTTLIQNVNTPNSSVMIQEIQNQFAGVQGNFTYTNNLITGINQSINANIDAVNTSLSNDIAGVNSIVTDMHTEIHALNTSIYQINDSITNTILNSQNNIINNISAQINAISFNSSEILEELHYMQGFNEELIFLVTDSVGLAKEAKVDYDNGDTQGAVDKLLEASEKLETARVQIEESKKPIENEYNRKTATNSFQKIKYWFKGLFL